MSTRPKTRRQFLKSSSLAAAGSIAAPALAKARSSAANRIRVGVVGIRGRGRSHIRSLQQLTDRDPTRRTRSRA